jgi:small-conductance mechanosensitive channel
MSVEIIHRIIEEYPVKQKKLVTDRIFLTVLILFFSIILWQSMGLTRTAGLMPKLITTVGIILCVLVLIIGFLKERVLSTKKEEKKIENPENEGGNKKGGDWQEMARGGVKKGLPLYATILVSIGYLVLFALFGFLIASIAVMMVVPLLLNYRKLLIVIPVAIISPLAIYFSFVYLFHVTLPTGLVFQLITGNL